MNVAGYSRGEYSLIGHPKRLQLSVPALVRDEELLIRVSRAQNLKWVDRKISRLLSKIELG